MFSPADKRPPNKTAPEDRVPVFQKVLYGLGGLVNNLLSGAFGSMAIILNLGLGMDPGAIGMIQAWPRLLDAFLDPIMGHVSDLTASRWGRRRPYIVAGALLTGMVFALVWQIPAGHSQHFYFYFFLVGTMLFYLAFSVYSTPLIALGYEMTPDYLERARIQGYSNLIGQIPWLILPWFYAFMENTQLFRTKVEGARTLAILVGITAAVIGVLPGIFCKEPYYAIAQANQAKLQKKGELAEFFKGFIITLKNASFRKLAVTTFLVFNGFTMIAGLGSYVIIFYIFGGDQVRGARYVGLFGTTLSVCTFVAISIVTWLTTKVGKKRAFMISISTAIAGYILKWFCYRPGSPHLMLLPAPLVAFGLGGLFTTVSAMIADVCDDEELETGSRREGMFGAVYWWMVKLGTAVALALSGHLLNLTGFQAQLGTHQPATSLFLMRVFEIGLPILAYTLALFVMAPYDLDGKKMVAIRLELEKRRGKVTHFL